MMKPLLLIAFTANSFFLASSTGEVYTSSSASSSSSAQTGHGYREVYTSSSASSSSSAHTGHGYPTCNNPNEIYDPCPAPCPPRTCDVDETLILCKVPPKLGDPECEPGCRCVDGYVKNHAGVCILKEQCPKCPKHEVFDPCIAPCPPRRCDAVGRLYKCAAPPQVGDPSCEAGCRCIDGYVRDYKGICIPKDNCPKCPKNEVFDPCIVPCPPRRCDVDERLIKCAPPPQVGDPSCEAGCRCIDGYKRNSEGVCIPKDQCPKCTKPHEVYDPCPSPCPPETCESIGKKNRSEKSEEAVTADVCVGKCVCEEGYYMNIIGECISKKECLTCKGPNEFFTCGSACDTECKTLNQTCPIVNIMCNRKCYCIPGYARDENDICIPIKDCKAKCTKPHEVYDPCPSPCPPETCESIGKKNRSEKSEEAMTADVCVGKCVCEEGYYMNIIGECISKKECLTCKGPNEFFTCGSACDTECKTLNQTCPIVNIMCNRKCYCIPGYARDENNICIPIKDCKVSCGGDKNAKPGCGVNCNKHCSDIGKEPGFCILSCDLNGCDCKDGYYFDDNTGKCEKPECCTPQCKANEWYSDCIQGNCSPQNCSQLGFPIPCPRIDPKYCKGGCLCIEGYVRNKHGICIPSSKCSSCGGDKNAKPGCGVNCNKHCSDIGKEPGFCILSCDLNGCDCKDGYYFDDNTGKCVKKECCTPQCKANERYSDCIQGNCSPQNCSQLGFPVPCLRIDPKDCIGGCLCIEGYVRNKHGVCIPSSKCSSCGGDPNAKSGCGGYCNRRCSDIGKEPRACILLCKINSCDCKEGHYYDGNINACVKPEQCTPTCCKNEEYNDCINANCGPQTCKELGFPISCADVDPKQCIKGCQCKPGYVRDHKRNCIPSTDCPSCGGDPNAKPGCGSNCHKHCSDIGKKPGVCPLFCLLNGCDCKDGYFYDGITMKCVKPENCTKTPNCSKNEVQSLCANGGCEMKNCSQLGQPQLCIDPIECKVGCICKNGYLRLKNGTCVPYDQCPTPKCNRNERFELCPAKVCQPQYCRDVGFPINCTAADDKCPGYPACICVNGYVRNKKGICRPKSECKQCGGDHNAQAGCGINCGKRCPNNNLNPKLCPRICLPNACDCKDGFFFDINIGKCVTLNKCSPRCDALNNEVYDPCVNGGCGWRNCSQVGDPIICIDPAKCIQGCKCKKNYYRLKNGTCVPENECPLNCRAPNEVYDPCPPNCPPQTCESINKKYFCPLQKLNPTDCKGQCRCKPNFYRNILGECVSKSQCLQCSGPHEYFSCGSSCDNVCSELDIERKNDCVIQNKKCVSRCYCEDGYARNKNGICIPICECPESNESDCDCSYED